MTPTREQVLDMSIASGLNDMLRLDSEASRILSVQRIERFAALVHAAARAQALEDAALAHIAAHGFDKHGAADWLRALKGKP